MSATATAYQDPGPAYWTKRVLTMDELAKYTGYSKSHIRFLVQQNEIPHSRPNKRCLFFDRLKIEEWLLRNSVKSNSEVDQEAANYIHRKSKVG
jgi:excisionase family DNA binding protein